MTQRFLQRYLRTLNQYKWLELASFAACVGGWGAIALRLGAPPVYKAEAVLIHGNSSPSALLSTTAAKRQDPGQQLASEMLLADNVIKTVAAQAQVDPQQVAKNVKVELSKQNELQVVKVLYVDTDRKRAVETLKALTRGMLQQSLSVNQARVRILLKSIDDQLPQLSQQLRLVEQRLDLYERGEDKILPGGIGERFPAKDAKQLAFEQNLRLLQEEYYKLLAAREDARLAGADKTVPLEIASPPQVVSDAESDRRVLQTLGIGVFGGLGIGAGFIPLLALMAQKPSQSEIRRKLLAAYNGRCAITGCDIPETLEAVQIYPECDRANPLSNWLILRADLKKLFEAHQLVIEPTTMTVLIDPRLAHTSYTELAGRPVDLPEDEAFRPSLNALKRHFRQYGWMNQLSWEEHTL